MYWKSKSHWKKPTKAGNSNEKPRQKTDEIMQRPVKPSKGIGKLRSEIVAKPKAKPQPEPPKAIIDPKPKKVEPVKVEPKAEEAPVEEEKVEKVEETSEESKEEPSEEIVDTNLTRKQLIAIAEEKGISISKRMSKQNIVDAINGEE